jgi:hypothetical protein
MSTSWSRIIIATIGGFVTLMAFGTAFTSYLTEADYLGAKISPRLGVSEALVRTEVQQALRECATRAGCVYAAPPAIMTVLAFLLCKPNGKKGQRAVGRGLDDPSTGAIGLRSSQTDAERRLGNK